MGLLNVGSLPGTPNILVGKTQRISTLHSLSFSGPSCKMSGLWWVLDTRGVLRGEGVVSCDSGIGNALQSGFRGQRRYFP